MYATFYCLHTKSLLQIIIFLDCLFLLNCHQLHFDHVTTFDTISDATSHIISDTAFKSPFKSSFMSHFMSPFNSLFKSSFKSPFKFPFLVYVIHSVTNKFHSSCEFHYNNSYVFILFIMILLVLLSTISSIFSS